MLAFFAENPGLVRRRGGKRGGGGGGCEEAKVGEIRRGSGMWRWLNVTRGPENPAW